MSISIDERKAVLDLFQYVSETIVVFDIGSNKGLWADIIIDERDSSTLSGKYKIYLFEPNKILLNYTRIKYEYNKNITYVGLAVYATDDIKLDFFYFENENNGLSSIYHNPKWDYLPMLKGEVKSITLDTYCENEKIDNIDFIKIDTEGSEYDVVLGCRGLLKQKKAKFIQVEYSEHYQLTNRKFTDFIDLFAKYGYDCHYWDGEYFVKISKDDFVEDYRLENFVFTYIPITKYYYTQPEWNKVFIKNTEKLKFDFVLEIGAFEGNTSNYICDNLLNEGGRVICIDPLEDVYLTDNISDEYEKINKDLPYFKGQYERFLRNTKSQPIELIRKKSSEARELIQEYRFDLVYVDGDHREISVYNDGVLAFEVLKLGGYIIFDDYEGYDKGTTNGINKFLDEYEAKINIVSKNYQVVIQKIKM